MEALLKHLPHYTYNDYIEWEGRWELIYGVPYAMSPAPAWFHQGINSRIIQQLLNKLENCKTCTASIYVDWKIDDDIVLQPDALVVCQPMGDKPYITVTPEMIFEILSPSTAEKDRHLKYEIYENAGVKYYILVNPKDKNAEIFILKNNIYESAGLVNTEPFRFETSACPFTFDFAKIW